MIGFFIFMGPLFAGMIDIFWWFFTGHGLTGIHWNEVRVIFAMASTIIATLFCEGLR